MHADLHEYAASFLGTGIYLQAQKNPVKLGFLALLEQLEVM